MNGDKIVYSKQIHCFVLFFSCSITSQFMFLESRSIMCYRKDKIHKIILKKLQNFIMMRCLLARARVCVCMCVFKNQIWLKKKLSVQLLLSLQQKNNNERNNLQNNKCTAKADARTEKRNDNNQEFTSRCEQIYLIWLYIQAISLRLMRIR